MSANSITICALSSYPNFFPEKSCKKAFHATRKHVDQSVRRIKRKFDLPSETARNAIGGGGVAKAREMVKRKQKTLVPSELLLPANSTIRFPGSNERQYLYP